MIHSIYLWRCISLDKFEFHESSEASRQAEISLEIQIRNRFFITWKYWRWIFNVKRIYCSLAFLLWNKLRENKARIKHQSVSMKSATLDTIKLEKSLSLIKVLVLVHSQRSINLITAISVEIRCCEWMFNARLSMHIFFWGQLKSLRCKMLN